MPDYALTGKKGTGKSKNAVRIIRDRYLRRGLQVATNLDLRLSVMFGPMSRITYVRLPDKPTAFDLEAAGRGDKGVLPYDEDKHGALVLDEMGTWINSRSFADKDRSSMLDFLAHGRKFAWDAYYIMQDVMQVDRQLRESFIEYTVRHVRFDRVKVPFIGGLLCSLLGEKAGYFPKFHRAVSRLGTTPQGLACDSWMFTGKDVEAAYDTLQVFRPDYAHGAFTMLSPWHVEGRYLKSPPLTGMDRVRAMLRGWLHGVRERPSQLAPKHPLVARLQQFPPDRRLFWLRRLQRAGLV
jgi:hypothetical protein